MMMWRKQPLLIAILIGTGVDGYEKLLFDAINGDQSHFVHSEEVIESWRIVDDLLCTGDKCPIRTVPTFTKKVFGVQFIRPKESLIGIIRHDSPSRSLCPLDSK